MLEPGCESFASRHVGMRWQFSIARENQQRLLVRKAVQSDLWFRKTTLTTVWRMNHKKENRQKDTIIFQKGIIRKNYTSEEKLNNMWGLLKGKIQAMGSDWILGERQKREQERPIFSVAGRELGTTEYSLDPGLNLYLVTACCLNMPCPQGSPSAKSRTFPLPDALYVNLPDTL